MPNFTSEMHEIQFRLGLRPRPRYSAPPVIKSKLIIVILKELRKGFCAQVLV